MASDDRRSFANALDRFGPWVVLGVFWCVGLATVADYGPTTDEPWRMLWSRGWMEALSTGEIEAYTRMPEREYYGVLYDMLGRLAWLTHHHIFGGDDEFFARHLLNLVAAGLGLLGTHRLARTLGGERVALLAMLFLATTPRYWGSACINPKDIPFTASAVWAAWGAIRLLQTPNRRHLVVAGALAGLCATIRPFGVVFYGVVAAAAGLGGGADAPWLIRARRTAAGSLIAFTVTFATWPVLWVEPPWHLVTASIDLTRHVHGSQSLFLGDFHPFWDAPAGYVVVWLGVTLPIHVVVGATMGLLGLGCALVRSRPPLETAFGWGLLALWVVGPAALPALKQTTLYDTSRHLLFMVPPLCILAALAWSHLTRLHRFGPVLMCLVVLVGVAGSVRSCIRLHPYASLHFNGLVGGLEGARRRFDVAHYSETYREGFDWIRTHHPTAAVHVVGNGSALGSYMGWKYGLSLNANRFEFFLSEVRQGWEQTLTGEVVHRVEREGVPLLEIRRVDPLVAAEIAYVRAWDEATPPPAPRGPDDPQWTRVRAREGAFDLDAVLHGRPGFVALRYASTDDAPIRTIWRYYLGLRIWSGSTKVFDGDVVPFQYRGTENFPSLMPITIPAAQRPGWLFVDVSRTRQHWSFGVYGPEASTRWLDADEV